MVADYFELFGLSRTASRQTNYDKLQRELLKVNNLHSQKAIVKQGQLKEALAHFQSERSYQDYLAELDIQQIKIDPPKTDPSPPPTTGDDDTGGLVGEVGSLLLKWGLAAGKAYFDSRRERAEEEQRLATLPASIAGQWGMRDGTIFQIQQDGSHVYLRGNFMGVMIEGQGMLQGRNLALQLRNSMGGGGTAQLTVAANNKRISGTLSVPYQGDFPLEMYR